MVSAKYERLSYSWYAPVHYRLCLVCRWRTRFRVQGIWCWCYCSGAWSWTLSAAERPTSSGWCITLPVKSRRRWHKWMWCRRRLSVVWSFHRCRFVANDNDWCSKDRNSDSQDSSDPKIKAVPSPPRWGQVTRPKVALNVLNNWLVLSSSG